MFVLPCSLSAFAFTCGPFCCAHNNNVYLGREEDERGGRNQQTHAASDANGLLSDLLVVLFKAEKIKTKYSRQLEVFSCRLRQYA